MHVSQLFAIALLGPLLGGCDKAPQTGMGFYLPPGNAQRGHETFVALKCNSCHTVAGAEIPAPSERPRQMVQLGGEVTRVRSYGDLVTSIIYPSHAVSDLLTPAARRQPIAVPMPEIASSMTVAQLVDVVAFLQPRYKEVMPTGYNYGYPLPP